MKRNRLAGPVAVVAGILLVAAPADAQVVEGLKAESGQGFTATVTPWIERDDRGWDHLSARATFGGDAIVGRDRNYHSILLCDPERKWQGRIEFYVQDVSEIEPREYAIVKRWDSGPVVLASFYMPLASTFQEGTLVIETVGPDGVTGSARATYAASKYLHLESGAPPETHTVEASFHARAIPELTPEGAPACYW